MNKPVAIFLVAFSIGAVAALGLRAVRHRPYAPVRADTTIAAVVAQPPVNTICAVCGMDVDPELPTAQYAGKTIGFGCESCPPKFASNPEHYGPAALQSRKAD